MKQLITARYPSNIALVKYWGKHGNQLPCNASLSMTLSNAVTEIKLQCTKKGNNKVELSYYFEGAPKENFRERIVNYVTEQKEFSGLLNNYAIRIDSKNSFPHSAGIASSASAYAAISAAFLKASSTCNNGDFNQNASHLARLGSGSACRSFYGPFAFWGHLDGMANSSNKYAVPVEEIHENFQSMKDTILIVEDEPKKVSSSIGHGLMKHHPFAEARFRQANNHCQKMLSILKNGDFESFISIVEREALSLHAMMMTSKDYYFLFKPGTVRIMDQVFRFRQDTGLPLCFTLDAGPNVHLLYPESIQDKVTLFLEQNLLDGLKNVIYDKAGQGGIIN